MSSPNTVQIWADGACSGNPGPGGWAAVLVHVPTGKTKELSSRVDHTTNMRMELTAIEQGLRAIRKPGQQVTIYTDALNAINWLTGAWKVKDAEIARLVGSIHAVVQEMGHTVVYQHVNGHSGVALNERANTLAQAEAQQARRVRRPGHQVRRAPDLPPGPRQPQGAVPRRAWAGRDTCTCVRCKCASLALCAHSDIGC